MCQRATAKEFLLVDFLFLINIFLIEVELIYNVVLISTAQKFLLLISTVGIHLCIFFLIFFFHYGLSPDSEYSSLCYTVKACC